jgi:hypothetical protein
MMLGAGLQPVQRQAFLSNQLVIKTANNWHKILLVLGV